MSRPWKVGLGRDMHHTPLSQPYGQNQMGGVPPPLQSTLDKNSPIGIGFINIKN